MSNISEGDFRLYVTRSLNQGHSTPDIQKVLASYGFSAADADRLISEVGAKNDERRAKEKRITRIVGLCVMGFGAALLGLAVYLGSTEVQSARYGRLMLGYLLGAGALIYGAWLLVTGRDTDLF